MSIPGFPQQPAVENFPQTVAPADVPARVFVTPGASFRGLRGVNNAAMSNMFLPDLDGMRLMGFSCMESAGTPAACSFRLWHGRDASSSGRLLLPVSLGASGSRLDWFGENGIEIPYGIFLEWVSGTFDLVLYYSTELLDVYARR